ncbi:hypothetical protein C8Q78DRAFT_978330, partial [Trametes maxima]
AIVVYEYLLTFQMERRVIWNRKLTVPTVLYLLNRYTLLLFALDLALWVFVSWDKDPLTCIYRNSLAFSALRIHAINNQNKFWTILIFLLGFLPVPPNIVRTDQSGQSATFRLRSYELTRLAVATEVSVILMEILVLGITWYRTAGIVIEAKKVQLETSLVSLMLRDGEPLAVLDTPFLRLMA